MIIVEANRAHERLRRSRSGVWCTLYGEKLLQLLVDLRYLVAELLICMLDKLIDSIFFEWRVSAIIVGGRIIVRIFTKFLQEIVYMIFPLVSIRPPTRCINHLFVLVVKPFIKDLNKLPFRDTMVWAFSKSIFKTSPCIM